MTPPSSAILWKRLARYLWIEPFTLLIGLLFAFAAIKEPSSLFSEGAWIGLPFFILPRVLGVLCWKRGKRVEGEA